MVEILVVVLIISITFSFAVVTFSDFGASRQARVAAEQFSTYIKFLEQQAILETGTFGIHIQPGGFQTLRFTQGKGWMNMSEKSLFHTRFFPGNVFVNIPQKISHDAQNPDILIDSSGDLTPFVLNFGTTKKPTLVTLVGRQGGGIILSVSKTP